MMKMFKRINSKTRKDKDVSNKDNLRITPIEDNRRETT